MASGEKPSFKKIFNVVLAGCLTLMALLMILGLSSFFNMERLLEQLELKTYDFRASLRWGDPVKRPSEDIVILKFDDPSLNVLSDEYGVWPWARDVHAELIEYLNGVGVKSMLFDLMFLSYRKGSEDGDRALAEAFKRYDNVYMSMNLDNELVQSERLGKGLTPRDIELLKTLSVPVVSELHKNPSSRLKLADGFFDNRAMTFNHYRPIMPLLLEKEKNIAFINHGPDPDGVSRSNPLFFRLKYHEFVKSDALPLRQVGNRWYDGMNRLVDSQGYLNRSLSPPWRKTEQGTWIDSDPRTPHPVDEEGYLLNSYGQHHYMRAYDENNNPKMSYIYLPYLGLRALLDIKFPDKMPTLTITGEGHLQFPGYDIPLNDDGDFQVNWFNINVFHEDATRQVARLKAIRQTLNPNNPEDAREIKKADYYINYFDKILTSAWSPRPYKEVAAWEVFALINKEKQGIPLTAQELATKNFLKDKIVFVGATAVAAYDLKNTPIHSTLPGVVLQANVFDNLYQNRNYMERVHPNVNGIITLLLCALAAAFMLRFRSALAGALFSANIAVIYVVTAVYLFKFHDLWINIAMPLASLVLATMLTFMLKYMLRDKDYEKTYALATTDSMTGLYNHRFFQEHMLRSIEQATRFKHKFTLVLVDIDFFKKFNDTYGHQAGDEVLRAVARKLKNQVRSVDVVARYGGEEMAVILDRATEEEGLAVARKLVKAVADEAYPIAEGVAKHVTISCGVATYPTHGATPSELIEFADQGLYRAKESGRNQVGAQYDNEPPSPEEEQSGAA